jgi:hypothetical protein
VSNTEFEGGDDGNGVRNRLQWGIHKGVEYGVLGSMQIGREKRGGVVVDCGGNSCPNPQTTNVLLSDKYNLVTRMTSSSIVNQATPGLASP